MGYSISFVQNYFLMMRLTKDKTLTQAFSLVINIFIVKIKG